MKHLGLRLKKSREDKGFSQEYVADCLKVSVSTISRIEKNPSEFKFGLVVNYANFLELNVVDLFCESHDCQYQILHVYIHKEDSIKLTPESIYKISEIISNDLKKNDAYGRNYDRK